MTSHRVGGKDVFRRLGIVLVLEVAAALTALPPTPVTLSLSIGPRPFPADYRLLLNTDY
ncbi:MAG: hypothetical protein ACKV19_19530 [Verrucomicrobiales bacterium]